MTYDLNITFDDNLITGNKTIDTQHKELIERIQNFVTACQNGDSKLKAIKMLDYLDEYTNFHFKDVIDWLFGHIKTYDRSVAEFIFMRENPDRY